MMCHFVNTLSLYSIIVHACFNPQYDRLCQPMNGNSVRDKVLQTVAILEYNVSSAFANNERYKHVQFKGDFDSFFGEMYTHFFTTLTSNLPEDLIFSENTRRLVAILLLKEVRMLDDLFMRMDFFLHNAYPKHSDRLVFYDQVILKTDTTNGTVCNFDGTLSFDKAVERQLYTNFMVSYVEDCRINNQLLEHVLSHLDLLVRNIELIGSEKTQVFVFHDIIYDFVNDTKETYNSSVLKHLISTIHEICTSQKSKCDFIFGNTMEFQQKCENIRKLAVQTFRRQPTLEHLVRILNEFYQNGYFSNLPIQVVENTGLIPFLQSLSRARSEECFHAFCDFYNKAGNRTENTTKDWKSIENDAVSSEYQTYIINNVDRSVCLAFIEQNPIFEPMIKMREPEKCFLSKNMNKVIRFIGVEYKQDQIGICPISQHVMTRAVGYNGKAPFYNYVNIILFWLHLMKDKQYYTYMFFDRLLNKKCDIRQFKPNFEITQSAKIFFERAGNLGCYHEEHTINMLFEDNVQSFEDVLDVTVRNFFRNRHEEIFHKINMINTIGRSPHLFNGRRGIHWQLDGSGGDEDYCDTDGTGPQSLTIMSDNVSVDSATTEEDMTDVRRKQLVDEVRASLQMLRGG